MLQLGAQEIRLSTASTLLYEHNGTEEFISATVRLCKPTGVEHVAVQAATLPVRGALSALVAAKATTLALAQSGGVYPALTVGRRYLIASGGLREWVRCKTYSSTTGAMTLYEPLVNGYPIGATVYSQMLTVAVSALQATPLGEGYEAQWTITTASGVSYASSYFDICRAVWAGVVATHEFRSYVGGVLGARVLANLDGAGLDFSDDIATATELLKADIRDKQYRPGLFRDPRGFGRAICERVLLGWAEGGRNTPSTWQASAMEYLEVRQQAYAQALAQSLNTVPYDADESGSASTAERKARLGSVRILL